MAHPSILIQIVNQITCLNDYFEYKISLITSNFNMIQHHKHAIDFTSKTITSTVGCKAEEYAYFK
jgi:hypothetical protein